MVSEHGEPWAVQYGLGERNSVEVEIEIRSSEEALKIWSFYFSDTVNYFMLLDLNAQISGFVLHFPSEFSLRPVF